MSWTNFRYKQVEIKKDRKCWACLRTFQAGSIMWHTVGAWTNDGLSSTYQCPTCETIQREMTWDEKQNYQDGYEQGWFWNEAQNTTENWREITPEQYLEKFVTVQQKDVEM